MPLSSIEAYKTSDADVGNDWRAVWISLLLKDENRREAQ
jgi:hypothetical protein